jgi:predicted transcriptional regulator of viral defense system
VARVSPPIRGQHEPPRREALLAELATRQHGVVTNAQLRAVGLGNSAIEHRAAAGRLHRIHRGVYAVGHPLLTIEGRWMAAVLACGRGAVLSHRSAAALWDLHRRERARTDVISPTNSGRSRQGVDAHRARSLPPDERACVRGIPCTSVARTLVDLAEVVDVRELERACNQAEMLWLLETRALTATLDRAHGRHGAALVRRILAQGGRTETPTRSQLEERFLALCHVARLPPPQVNVWIAEAAAEVDFAWPAQRLIVETDGRAVHATRHAFENDRRRDQRLTLAGYRVVRFTWDQVKREPREVAETVRRLLNPRSATRRSARRSPDPGPPAGSARPRR